MTIALDFDDLEVGKPGLDYLVKLREHYPGLKVTFFMVPVAEQLVKKQISLAKYREWADYIKAQDWIEVCPHGVMHRGFEMKYEVVRGKEKLLDAEAANLYIDAAEHTFDQLGLPYQKIWKSPHWESAPATLEALWERGYTIACDPNQEVPEGGPVYLYDWSVEKPFPKGKELVKGHGHMYPPSTNAITLAFSNMLKMPTDAEFKFVSELL